jgi:Domain of Unknown Function (DUF1259)
MNKKQVTVSASAVALAMLFIAAAFIGNMQSTAVAASSNNKSNSDEQDKCIEAAKKISNDADGHASSNVCEIGLARGSPTIKLLGQEANDLTDNEFKYQKASASGNDNVLFLAEIQLVQNEVGPVEKSLIDKGWEVTAIHNHELHEDPLMIFLHAQKSDNLDILLQDIRNVLNDDTNCDCIS